MRIIFDHDLMSDGSIAAIHYIETSDPAVQAVLTSAKAGLAAQTTAGFNVLTKHPSYLGQTRWQAILGEVVRLNDTTARPILGV